MPAKPALLIFDMDGLLVDSERVYFEGWAEAFRREGIEADPEWLASWSGKSVDDCHREILARYGDEDLHTRLRRHREDYIYQSLYSGNLAPKPFAPEALEWAKAHGFQLAVATSCKEKRMHDILSHTGLIGYFDYFANADNTEHLKPAPDLYLSILEKAGRKPEEAIAFEDSLTGYQAAENAGIFTYVIPDLHEIDPSMLSNGKLAENLDIVRQIPAEAANPADETQADF